MMVRAVRLIVEDFPVSKQFETLKPFQSKKDKQTDFQGQQTDLQGQQTDLQGQQTDLQGQQTDLQGPVCVLCIFVHARKNLFAWEC